MERMLCAQCAAVTYSAAAWKLVERGDRCLRCGGELRLAPTESLAGAPAREEQERQAG